MAARAHHGVRIRRATTQDAGFILEMLAEAASWQRPAGAPPPAVEDVLTGSSAHYGEGWPRRGDAGAVAELDGRAVGACWIRFLTADDPGWGYVADDVPEVSIAVREHARRRGIGTGLLATTVDLARQAGIRGLSLSVSHGNAARRIYERAGFVAVGEDGVSATLLLTLAGNGGTEQGRAP